MRLRVTLLEQLIGDYLSKMQAVHQQREQAAREMYAATHKAMRAQASSPLIINCSRTGKLSSNSAPNSTLVSPRGLPMHQKVWVDTKQRSDADSINGIPQSSDKVRINKGGETVTRPVKVENNSAHNPQKVTLVVSVNPNTEMTNHKDTKIR